MRFAIAAGANRSSPALRQRLSHEQTGRLQECEVSAGSGLASGWKSSTTYDSVSMSRPEPAPSPDPRRGAASGSAIRARVARAIVDAAAEVFARDGLGASMAAVAAAAGVARATVYRYFPTRQALLEGLTTVALDDAAARLAATEFERVHGDEAVTRVVRALMEVGDYLTVLGRERIGPGSREYERRIAIPLRRLFERGQAAGAFRDDVPTEWLASALVTLVITVLRSVPTMGRDDAVAAISSLFMDGVRARSEEAAAT